MAAPVSHEELYAAHYSPHPVGPDHEELCAFAYAPHPQEPVEELAAEIDAMNALIDAEDAKGNTIEFAQDW